MHVLTHIHAPPHTHTCIAHIHTHMKQWKCEVISLVMRSLATSGGGGRDCSNLCASSSINGNNGNVGSRTAAIVATVVTSLAYLYAPKSTPSSGTHAMFHAFFKPKTIIMGFIPMRRQLRLKVIIFSYKP